MKRWRHIITFVAFAALLGAACSDGEDGAAADSTTTIPVEAAAGGSTTALPPSTTATVPVDHDFGLVAEEVDTFVAAKGLNGAGLIIVDRDEGVIFEHHTGEIDRDRISLIASSSKMITAGVLMRLHDEGVLDVDAPIADVVDWGSANPAITPVQLVSNSSGLIGLTDGLTVGPYLCQYAAAGTLQDCAEGIFTTPADDDEVIPPDTEFRYGGAQWQVAGAVAEIASGKSWAQLIEETYVEPCQLDALAYNNHFSQVSSETGPFSYPEAFDGDPTNLDPTDNPNMEGGAYITTGDYGALLLMHLRGGMCGDHRVLTEESIDRMHRDRIGEAYGGDTEADLEGYGLGWWVDRDDPAFIQDGGAFGALPWIDLDRGYGAYLVVERTNFDGRDLGAAIRPLIETEIDRHGTG